MRTKIPLEIKAEIDYFHNAKWDKPSLQLQLVFQILFYFFSKSIKKNFKFVSSSSIFKPTNGCKQGTGTGLGVCK